MLFAREVVCRPSLVVAASLFPNAAAMQNPMVYPTKQTIDGMKQMHNSTLKRPCILYLVHLPDQLVDVLFPVAQVTALNKVLELPLVEAAIRAV